MTFFEVTTLPADGDLSRLRTWLIIAESESDARNLVPSGYRIQKVITGHALANGPSRQIGWLGAPPARVEA